MPKRRRSAKQPPDRLPQSKTIDPNETRASVLATVAWSLAVMTTLMCQLAAIAGRLLLLWAPEADMLLLFSQWMLWCAAFIGVLAIALLPVVYRVRRVLPPTGLTVFAVCASIGPILAIVLQQFR